MTKRKHSPILGIKACIQIIISDGKEFLNCFNSTNIKLSQLAYILYNFLTSKPFNDIMLLHNDVFIMLEATWLVHQMVTY